jgi:single-strand DNA-binding protein
MNKCELVGRLVRDPEVRYSQGEKPMANARFTVAVDRRFKNAVGNYDADFISCTSFGKTAEFIEKYFKKGMKIGIVGHIQTGNYTNKDGVKVYTTDVVVDDAEFVESKGASVGAQTETSQSSSGSDFMNIPDDIEEELPFN